MTVPKLDAKTLTPEKVCAVVLKYPGNTTTGIARIMRCYPGDKLKRYLRALASQQRVQTANNGRWVTWWPPGMDHPHKPVRGQKRAPLAKVRPTPDHPLDGGKPGAWCFFCLGTPTSDRTISGQSRAWVRTSVRRGGCCAGCVDRERCLQRISDGE